MILELLKALWVKTRTPAARRPRRNAVVDISKESELFFGTVTCNTAGEAGSRGPSPSAVPRPSYTLPIAHYSSSSFLVIQISVKQNMKWEGSFG